MTVSPTTGPFMEEIWDNVVRASGFDGSQVHLLPVPGAAAGGHNQAACYPPGDFLVDDPDDIIRGDMLAEANLDEHLHKHRIAIYEDVDEDDDVAMAVLAGKLRHELRHAEQREACGAELFSLDDLAGMLISWKAGGLPRSNVLYHLKPIEMDANAASASVPRGSLPSDHQCDSGQRRRSAREIEDTTRVVARSAGEDRGLHVLLS
jgi:hypothetical protein